MTPKEIYKAVGEMDWPRKNAILLVDRIRNELTVLSAHELTLEKLSGVRDRLEALAGALDRSTLKPRGLPLREKFRQLMSDGRWHAFRLFWELTPGEPASRRKKVEATFAELQRPEHGSCCIEMMHDPSPIDGKDGEEEYRTRLDLVTVKKGRGKRAKTVVADKAGQVQLDDGGCMETKGHHEYPDNRKR